MSKIFESMVKDSKKNSDFGGLLGDHNPYDVDTWIDTGCYALNAVLSDGDILKGLPKGNKVMIAGESSTAKSIFTSFMIAKYLNQMENSSVVIYETEGSRTIANTLIHGFGIDESRILLHMVGTVEKCRTLMVNYLDKIIDEKTHYKTVITPKGEKKRTKLTKEEIKKKIDKDGEYNENIIFVIDSLGMLSTEKETADVSSGSDKKDMTRAQLLRGFGRTISLKLSQAQSPLVVVNHIYSTMDQYNPKQISGGDGPKYMADIVLFLTKSKEKEGKEQVGVKIRVYVNKSRYMIENKSVEILINFKRGLYKWSNIVEMAYDFGVFKKDGHSFVMPNGEKVKMKEVVLHPSKYIDAECLELIRTAIKNDFSFGKIVNEGDDYESENLEDFEDGEVEIDDETGEDTTESESE